MPLFRPVPRILTTARILLLVQLGIPALVVLEGLAFLPLRDAQTNLQREVVIIAAAAAVGAVTFLLAIRIGPGRRWSWLGAALLQLAFAVAYGWGAYWAVTAPRREGLLAVGGVVIGATLVPISLVGLGFLLASARLCLRRQPA